MRRYALSLLAVCGLAILTIALLRPDPAVRLEASLALLEPEAALSRLERARGHLAFTENLHLAHARLAVAAGDLKQSAESYARILAETGPKAAIFDDLAQVALLSGNMPGAAEWMEKAHAAEASDTRRQTLGYWYRILRDSARERALLEGTPPTELTAFERDRLAELLLAAGRRDDYRDLLVELSRQDDAPDYRVRLLQFLIESGEKRRALQTALRWHADAQDDLDQTAALLEALIGRGAIDEASRFAWRVLARDPGAGSVLVTTLVRSGHGGIAREIQQVWIDVDSDFSRSDWQELSTAAEISGDLRGLHQSLALHGLSSLRKGELAGKAFLQILRYRGAAALVPWQGLLTEDILAEEPLVAAAWASWRRRPQETYDHLLRASQSALVDWDRTIWLSIAQDLRGTPYYQALLAGTPGDARLRDEIRATLMPEAVTTGDRG
jgi:hypothetical protein